MAASPRHWRFLRNREFDIAEVSGSGYVAARDQDLPFRAIPVFPHRRFRHGFIFVNTGKGIAKPTDLIGRKVGSKGYLFTAGLWMRGILEHDYGVPHDRSTGSASSTRTSTSRRRPTSRSRRCRRMRRSRTCWSRARSTRCSLPT